MALIKCPECKKQVSSTAASCPQCGAPIAGSVGAGTPLVTTQLTSKRLKTQIALSALMFCIGAIWAFVGANVDENASPSPVAIIISIVGIIWFIVTRIRIWWHHG